MKLKGSFLLLLIVIAARGALLDAQSLAQLDVESIGCDRSRLYDAEEGLQKLQEALSMVQTGKLERDIQELREIQLMAKQGMEEAQHVSFIQISNAQMHYMMKHKFQALSLLQMPSLARPQTEKLRDQINMVLASTDQETKKNCCEMLYTMIELLLLDLIDMEEQCQKPITINIEGEIKRIQIIRGDCEHHEPTPVLPTPPPPKEPTKVVPPPKPEPPKPEPPKPEPPKPEPPKPEPPKPEPPKPEPPKPEPPKPKDPTPPKPQPPKPPTPIVIPPPPKPVDPTPPPKKKTPLPPPKPVTPPPPPPPKEPSPPIVIQCIKGVEQVVDSSASGDAVADSKVQGKDLAGASEYGYGFWLRWLTRFPDELINGRQKGAFHFVSRLTTNPTLGDLEFGDRTLAIWLSEEGYLFATVDVASKNPNVYKTIKAGDIEGQWTYLYFGYSLRLKKATAHMRVGAGKVQSLTIPAVHQVPTFLRMIIGGKQFNYPGFNGQFTKPIFKLGEGAYADTEAELQDYVLKCNPIPLGTCKEQTQMKLVTEVSKFEEKTSSTKDIRTSSENTFPEEYSVSGWFKWLPIAKQEPWHLAFRVYSTKENSNAKNLGDRDLAMWLGTGNGGILAMATYSYTNLFGEGNPNIHNSIEHKNQHTAWMFVYFGYSFKLKKAHGFISFKDNKEDRTFESINHFLVPRLSINLAKDQHYPSWNGYIAHFRVILCDKAYDPEFPIKDKPPVTPIRTPPKIKTKTPPPKTPIVIPPKPITVKPPKVPTVIIPPTPIKKDSTPPAIVVQKCVEGQADIGDSSSAAKSEPVADIKVPTENLKDVREYGYGFWSRWLTRYPEPLLSGIKEPWYFISRLTSNQPYTNDAMGDRTLAIWLGLKGYAFITIDAPSKNPNKVSELPYDDIEGVWTYIHFSYSPADKKAVGMIFANKKTQIVEIPAVHEVPKTLRFILGGSDLGIYPGFNGQFSRPVLKVGPGSHLGTPEGLQNFALMCNPVPKADCGDKSDTKLIQGTKQYNSKLTEVNQFVADNNNQFPDEYNIQGWFLWRPTEQEPWHLAFRVTINGQKTNKNAEILGDRDLSAWLGTHENGAYLFATYTYTNMFGAGNPNTYQSITHADKHKQWHYIYFAYSRAKRQAYSQINFFGKKEVKIFSNVNHYLSALYRVFVGKDQFYPAYNGYIADVKFQVCKGAFDPEFNPPEPPLPPKEKTIPIKPPTPPPKEPTPENKPEPVCKMGDPKILDSPVDGLKPLADLPITGDGLKYTREYGYSIWIRFLTRYPVPLFAGKKEPWYFVSRLTSNQNYGNLEMGDRLLAIWQGQGAYFFMTHDEKTKNPNLYKQIEYGDIEGVWTYVYYSYGAKGQATAFVKYGDAAPVSVTIPAVHSKPNYLRLVIGGTDLNLYPSFSGQMTRAVLKVGYGAYLETPEQFQKYAVACNPPPPPTCSKVSEVVIIKDSGKFETGKTKENEIQSPAENIFPDEYSVSGWFKWRETKMELWHLAFRLHINKGADNANVNKLGDRALGVWASSEGNYAFTTYTYTNLNGGGNPNLYKEVKYTAEWTDWHFIYFGYQRSSRKAVGFVQFKSTKINLNFDDVNHYLSKFVYLNIGKDRFYPAWNGYIGKLIVNLCGGAFIPKFDQPVPQPPIPQPTPTPKQPTPPPKEPTPVERKCVAGQKDIGDAVSSGDAAVDIKVPADRLEGVEEYGYGLWTRFLTRHPDQLSGLTEPWYFLSRLTTNEPYDNIRMGDRTLAIWLGAAGYTFITNDQKTTNPNLLKQLPFGDLEGRWTYVHFSYSLKAGQAVGFIFSEGKSASVQIPCVHAAPKRLRLIIAGSDLKLYPGFNGQVSAPILKVGRGAYVGSEDELKNFVLSCNPQPVAECKENVETKVVTGLKKYDAASKEVYEYFKDEDHLFPEEYHIRGWFRWSPLQKQEAWHLTFRVTINDQKTNKNAVLLGDRDLSLFLGQADGGIFAFATYSYEDAFGKGNPNVYQMIKHNNQHLEWHYVYFAYSRPKREAYAAVHFKSGKQEKVFSNVNHYLAPYHRILVGKDQFYTAYNGYVSDVLFTLCKDAYNPAFKPPEPPKPPKEPTLVKPPTPPPKVPTPESKPEPVCKMGTPTIIDSPVDAAKPLADLQVTGDGLNDTREYGYSFWMRFLTRYPTPLYAGKKEPWYFVSRLTSNPKYANAGMGDRLLAIFQGQGSYAFATNDVATSNPNVFKSIEYEDIEAVWTFVYFSYGAKGQATAIIQYGEKGTPQVASIPAKHSKPEYLRLLIGGTDLGIYPAFNGQFTRAVLKVGYGAYLESVEQFKEFALKCNPAPAPTCSKIAEIAVIPQNKKFEIGKAIVNEIQSPIENQFPDEYSVSGWFKWATAKMDPWHLAFRLHINKEETNKNAERLGDRTLALWASPSSDGIYAFATYSYTNLNGAGNPNVFKTVQYQKDLTEWHFIFFAYSRAERKATAFVQFKGRKETLEFEGVNHYLPQFVFLNVGKDRFYPSWNGSIGKLRLNLCGGAFLPNFPPDNQKPPEETPIVIPPPELVQDDVCLKDTKLIEVTTANVREVIKKLDALDKEWNPDRTCFCTLPPKKPKMALIELHGEILSDYEDHPIIQRLIAQNYVRLRN